MTRVSCSWKSSTSTRKWPTSPHRGGLPPSRRSLTCRLAEMLEIEGLDEEIVNELRTRAAMCPLTEAIVTEESRRRG